MTRTARLATGMLAASILALPACMTVPKGVGSYDAGFVDRGHASWYGGYFHGRPTASGEIYDQFGMTAAHRLLPLGSVVHVTNVANGRGVVVVINDRGPYIRGRIIDLSYGAARQLGAVERGVLPVLIEVVRTSNRMDVSPFLRKTSLEPSAEAQWEIPRHAESLDARASDAWLFEVERKAGQIVRGPMDMLQLSRRARRLAYSRPSRDRA